MVKFSNKLVPKKSVKKRDRVKKKRDSSKFWTKNQDCPSKSGTVGKYETFMNFVVLEPPTKVFFTKFGHAIPTCDTI